MHPDWAHLNAPSIDALEALARAAFETLPEEFRRLCDGVIFRVEEFPDEAVMKEMELESEFDLLGLFTGVGLPAMGAGPMTGQLPNTVYLYRRPILDYWAEYDETLGHLVAHVLIHEIGHHLGLSDQQLEAIEAKVA